jgi:hypothetical protein
MDGRYFDGGSLAAGRTERRRSGDGVKEETGNLNLVNPYVEESMVVDRQE